MGEPDLSHSTWKTCTEQRKEPILTILAMAHEMGHSLGLLHEHTRSDRDQFVQYSCVNVLHYKEKLEEAKNAGKIKEQLCTHYDTAVKVNFYGSEFVSVTYGQVSPGYHYWSIMHYSSFSFSDPDLIALDPKNPDYYPMAALFAGGKKSIIPLPFADWEVSGYMQPQLADCWL